MPYTDWHCVEHRSEQLKSFNLPTSSSLCAYAEENPSLRKSIPKVGDALMLLRKLFLLCIIQNNDNLF